MPVRFLVISNDTRALALVQGVQAFLQAGHCGFQGFYLPSYPSVCPLEFGGPVHGRLEAFLEECFKALNALLEEVDAAVGIIESLTDICLLGILLGGKECYPG